MRNQWFKQSENVIGIILERKKGSPLITLVDTDDLSRLLQLDIRWCALWTETSQHFRVKAIYKRKTIYLHRFIMDAPKDKEVDHVNFDGLDNRKSNLRVVTRKQNQQNKRGLCRSDNKSSGHRNVYFDKTIGKYKVCFRIDGKSKHIGVYESLDVAKKVADELRPKLMPYSKRG